MKSKKIITLLALLLSVCMLFACGAPEAQGGSSSGDSNDSGITDNSEKDNVESNKTESEKTEDKETEAKTYTVIWANGDVLEIDDNVAFGAIPSYNGPEPKKEATAEYTYKFSGWTPTVGAVEGNITFSAQFEAIKNKYTVVWKNADGTVLETDEQVEFGTIPSYDGAEPKKSATEEYNYIFSGWSPSVGAVKGEVVYTAQFEEKSLFKFTETRDGYAIDAYYGTSTRVTFPAKHNGKDIVEIGSYVLANNATVLEIVLPDTVKKIGDGSFSHCPRLYKINIPAQCTDIGSYVMAKTDIDQITLPASINNIGPLWLYGAPLKTLRFEGTPTYFVGDCFGRLNGIVDLTNAANKLSDHFDSSRTDSTEEIWIGSGGYMSNYPKYSYFRWELKDDNRWFETTINNPYSDAKETVKVFANENNSDYYYTEILTRTEKRSTGATWYHYDYTEIQGSFSLLPGTLETIEISRNAGVDEATLIGYASFLNVTYFD